MECEYELDFDLEMRYEDRNGYPEDLYADMDFEAEDDEDDEDGID
jgi:hypothetical protein